MTLRKWILLLKDFTRVSIIDQDDCCVISDETDHLLTRMLAHPTNGPVSLNVDSGRTARRHMEKMQTARREACVRTAFRRQCHAAAPLCCPAMDAINPLYSTFVQPNSPSTCGHCLTPASVVWILFYLVGFHSALTLYSLLMPVDANLACDAFAWWQTGSSSTNDSN